MTTAPDARSDADSVDGVVDEILSRLGLHAVVETEATTNEHAADVAGLIADAAAERARFEDTLDAS